MRDTGVRGRFSYGWGQDLALDKTMDLDGLARTQREVLAANDLITLGAYAAGADAGLRCGDDGVGKMAAIEGLALRLGDGLERRRLRGMAEPLAG